MNTVFLLSLAATTMEMTVCILCARLLWHLLTEDYDRSRRMLAMGSLASGIIAGVAILGIISMDSSQSGPVLLRPWLGLLYLSMHIVMTLYPISVVKPGWLTPKHFFWLFFPVVFFGIAFLFFAGRWTPLDSTMAIWENLGKPDVLLRLATQLVMLPYCLILFLLPYNYHRTSATFWWIMNYSFGLSAICVVHIIFMVTFRLPLMVVLPFLASIFYYFSTEYELRDRIRPGSRVQEEPDVPEEEPAPVITALPADVPAEFGLWTRICQIMDQEEAWRDPDLSLVAMAHRCTTNVTYLNRIIREETGSSFKDLLNNKRIESVATQLRDNPNMDVQEAFFNAGYRSRTTAWRNFRDIMGVTPTEFRQGLGENKLPSEK